VYCLYVRARLVRAGCLRPAALHAGTSRRANALAQAGLLRDLDNLLAPEERDIVRRGRNAAGGRAPRGVPAPAYRASTGLEALLGYLYLSGRLQRLDEILDALWDAAQQ